MAAQPQLNEWVLPVGSEFDVTALPSATSTLELKLVEAEAAAATPARLTTNAQVDTIIRYLEGYDYHNYSFTLSTGSPTPRCIYVTMNEARGYHQSAKTPEKSVRGALSLRDSHTRFKWTGEEHLKACIQDLACLAESMLYSPSAPADLVALRKALRYPQSLLVLFQPAPKQAGGAALPALFNVLSLKSSNVAEAAIAIAEDTAASRAAEGPWDASMGVPALVLSNVQVITDHSFSGTIIQRLKHRWEAHEVGLLFTTEEEFIKQVKYEKMQKDMLMVSRSLPGEREKRASLSAEEEWLLRVRYRKMAILVAALEQVRRSGTGSIPFGSLGEDKDDEVQAGGGAAGSIPKGSPGEDKEDEVQAGGAAAEKPPPAKRGRIDSAFVHVLL